MKTQTEEVLFSASALAFFIGVAALLGYETYALAAGKPPITWRFRKLTADHPRVGTFIALSLGLLLGHLFLSQVNSVEKSYEASK